MLHVWRARPQAALHSCLHLQAGFSIPPAVPASAVPALIYATESVLQVLACSQVSCCRQCVEAASPPCRHSSHEESPLHPRSVSHEGHLIFPAARRADMFVVSPVAGQRLAMNVLTHLLFVKDGLFVADSSAGIRVYLRPQAGSRQSSPSQAPSAEPPPAKPAVSSHPLEHKADSPSESPGPAPAPATGGGSSGATQQRSGVAARQLPSGSQSAPSGSPGRAQQPLPSPYSTQAAQAGIARQTSSRNMGSKSSMAAQNSGGMARQASGGLQRQGSRQGSIATGTASRCTTHVSCN